MTLVSEHIEPDTRERILVVAERLFREIGYQKTTVGRHRQGAADEPGERLSLLRFEESDP